MSDVNYDRLSTEYGERYRVNPLAGIERAMRRLIDDLRPTLGLEVGCGTGRWLPALTGSDGRTVGVDLFPGMLAEAHRSLDRSHLVCAGGDHLPFEQSSFDLIAAINAIHHFEDPARFIRRCADCLRPGGRLALVHYDPGREGQSWYVYDEFEGALDEDLGRFPRAGKLIRGMRDTGLDSVACEVAETIERHYVGNEVLGDYFIGKDSNSTLARLSDKAYAAGLHQLRQRIARADGRSETLRFDVKMEFLLLTGCKP
jgi:SAM-dependent methyltransferase